MKLKSVCGDKKTGKILIEAGILIMVVNLLCTIGIWQSILNGWKIISNREVFSQAFIQSGGKYAITYLNQESIYISFLSVLFSFLGNKEELVSIINLILQLIGIGFFYLGAKKLFCLVFSLAVAVMGGILSACFYPVTTDSSMHIIWFLSGFAFWMTAKSFHELNGLYRKHILLGILIGIFCYVDFAGFFFLILCVLFTFNVKEFSLKEKGLQLLCFSLCVVNGFFCMFYLWNNLLFNTAVFQYWFSDKMKYFMQENGWSRYFSLVIMLVVSCVFYVMKRYEKDIFILSELKSVFQQIPEQEEQKMDKAAEPTKETAIVNDTKVVTEQTVESNLQPEMKETVQFLENPLPVPKKHVRKEMDYAFEPSKEQMHYDLNNYRLDDDYDLKD